MPWPEGFTTREHLFVIEYLKDFNGTQAATRAGYAPKHANSTAYQLLQREDVKAAVETAIAERKQRIEITTDDVLRELWAIATADHNELVEFRRTCCRHCWGIDFKYQFTPKGLAAAKREHAAAHNREDLTGNAPPPFDEQGGSGFDVRKDPNADCPECFGEGIETPFVKDTRLLSREARALYAGVKITKDGIEVKTQSKEKALELVGRHLGMFTDKVDVTLKGDLAQRIVASRKRAG